MNALGHMTHVQSWSFQGRNGASSATFSPCGKYRYELRRAWDATKPALISIGLNPSTADAYRPDNTVTRELGYAARWGCGAYIKLNVFAWRSTDPKVLPRLADPVGPENDLTIERVLRAHPEAKLVLTWGANGTLLGRGDRVAQLALDLHDKPECFGLTNNGQPMHPLRLPYRLALQSYRDVLRAHQGERP